MIEAALLFLKPIGAFLASIPLKVYLIAGAIAALLAADFWHVHVAVEAEASRGKAQLVAQAAAFQKQIKDARDAAQARLDALELYNKALAEQRDAAVKLAEQRRVQAIANLKKGFQNYVTPLQLSRCPDVPRGFLLFGADAATYANGGSDNPPAAPASAVALDPPSGVSLAALADTVADQAGAYRACRTRVDQWEQWGKDVDVYVSKLQFIFKPKGVTSP